MDAAKRGAIALDASKYEEAIEEYTEALRQHPKSPDYYLKRSSAYSRSSPAQWEAALKDAELGLHFALERAKREVIGQAQLRRATIYYGMGQFGNAQFLLEFVKKLDKENKTLPIWEIKINGKLKGLAEGDDAAKVTTTEKPKVELPEERIAAKSVTETATAPSKAAVQTPASQIKHDWYQSKDAVYFSLLAKGVPHDKTLIEIEETSISITFPTTSGTDYNFSLDPLFDAIDATTSSSRITPTKVEVTLKKKTPGRQWKSLESPNGPTSSTSKDTSADAPPRPMVAETKAPAYPTSSKSGPKDWDKVVNSMTQKPKGEEEGVGEMDDLDYGGDEANFFFKKLYAGADEDTKRAMMKSYVESNGTVLSTNWSEVGKGKVETSPPDGMDAKKWGE